MLTYKQRYKPRTTREYTKSDLTVYDSAGNTALNALTIYGKSEVVDGVIKSAGEGYAVVDLGTLEWTAWNEFFYTAIVGRKPGEINLICEKYPIARQLPDKYCTGSTSNSIIYVKDTDYTDATAFKAAMSGVLLCYELADLSQGNTIAIKTDNGTGIDGTMATFTTGTPLYGIDENARDVMEWSGSSGVVTKKCNKVRLADLTWRYRDNGVFYTDNINDYKFLENVTAICEKYTYIGTVISVTAMPSKPDKSIALFYQDTQTSRYLYIKDTDYTTVSDFVASLGDAELVYELATPTTTPLTQAENESIASLRTFATTTHFTNNSNTNMTINYTMRVPSIS